MASKKEKQIYDILTLSGIEKSRATKLASVLSRVEGSTNRPSDEEAKAYVKKLAERAVQHDSKIFGVAVTESVRKRIEDILMTFYVGLATCAVWDGVKFFLEAVATMTMSGSEKVDPQIEKARRHFQKRLDETPKDVKAVVGSDMVAQGMLEVWEGYREYIDRTLRTDPTIVAFYKERSRSPSFPGLAFDLFTLCKDA